MTILRQIRYLTFRSIRARWLRFLLSAFGIILGVAGMLAIRVTNEAAMNSIVRLFANTAGSAKLSVTSASQDTTALPEKALRLIGNTPGVALASPIVRVNTLAAEDAVTDELSLGMLGATTSGGLTLYGIDPARDPEVREYKLMAGRFLKDRSSEREVVLVQDYAEDQELQIGDGFSILTPTGAENLKVVGLIAREGAGQTNNGSFGVIPLDTAQELFNRKNELDQVDILTGNPNPPRASWKP